MRIIIILIAAACAPLLATAREPVVRLAHPEFLAREHQGDDGKRLPYRLLVPKDYRLTEHYPLVIWMHGSGERGDDNQRQLSHGVANAFLAPSARTKHPCFVLVPQAPLMSNWTGRHLNRVGDVPDTVQMLLDTILELEAEFRIDDRRIYVGGFSMGGFGTWELISRFPNLAAAAFPMGGTPRGWETICLRLKDIPIWMFHGERDTGVPVDWSRRIFAALKGAGGDVRYTELPGGDHGSALKGLADPGFLDWLYAQKRAMPASLEPVKDPENSVVITRTMLPGTHGTWKGPVNTTRHAAPRIVIDEFPYRLQAPQSPVAVIVATLEGISKGTIQGIFEVTGTVLTADTGHIAIDVESIKRAE
jgi:predicted peptidase